MTRSLLGLTVLLLPLSAGCGSANSAGSTGPSAWEQANHPYTIVGVTRANVPRVSEQKRVAQLIVSAPASQAQVLSAVRETYDALIHEIREAQPDAEYRSVGITVYDSNEDLRLDRKGWLCQIRLSPEKGESFPESIENLVTWQWRDPGQAPTAEDRQIEWDFLKELAEVDAAAAVAGVTDAELSGLNGIDRRAFYEDRYHDDVVAIKEDLAANAKVDISEVQAALDRVLHWKFPDSVAGGSAAKVP
jgi:hypothetical protein